MKYCIQCMRPLVNGQCPDGCLPPAGEPAPHILPPGTLLNGRYLVGRMLGQGGFGITYIGRDQVLDIRVAIKEYYPSGFVTRNVTASQAVIATGQDKRDLLSQESEKFLAEARILAKFIGEPGIVDVRDYFRANNTAYIVMEYLDGENLRDCVLRRGRLTPEETIALLEPVMRSLDKVHQAGLIHRDVSPDNIMLLSGGGVKLLDFGTARSASPYGEQSLSVMLKPGYAPEEQYRSKGSQGPWTDVYGLCATMYKCITGITPEDSLQRLYEDTVQPPSKLGIPIPPAQEAALMMGMACRMTNRFQSIGALAAALGIGGFALPPEQEEMPNTVLVTEEPPEELTRPIFQGGAQGPSTRPLFHEQQEPAPTPPPAQPKAPPPAPTPPPAQPAQQKKTSKNTGTQGALIAAGVFLLVIVAVVLTTFQVLRVNGIMTGRSTGDRARDNDRPNSSASADSSKNQPVSVLLGETVTLTGHFIHNGTEYEKEFDDFVDQYDGDGIMCTMAGYGVRFDPVINLKFVNSSIQIQEAEASNLYEYFDINQLFPGDEAIYGYAAEITGYFSRIEAKDQVSGPVYSSQMKATLYSYHPNGDYEFHIEGCTLLESPPVQPAGPEGSSSGSSSASGSAFDPTEAAMGRITQYATVKSFSPLTRLGAAELAAGYLDLQLSDDPGLPFEDCRGIDRQERAVIAAVTSSGIMASVTPTFFEPDSTVTVAQMAYLIWTLNGSPEPDPTGMSFEYVSPDHWAYNSFVWLVNIGILSDFSEDPDDIADGNFMLNTLFILSTQ